MREPDNNTVPVKSLSGDATDHAENEHNAGNEQGASGNLRGALLMSLGMAAFIGNVTLMKLVSFDLTLFQAIFLRGCCAAVVLGAVSYYRKELFVTITGADARVLTIRVIGEVGASLCYFMALFNMPVANVTAILQALPLVVTLGAAVFLGETVGWRRYGGIALGFVGVLIIVQPGTDGFSVYSLWALASMLSVALRDLATRKISSNLPSLFVAFVTMVVVTLVCAVLLPTMEWKEVKGDTIGLLLGAAVFIMLVHITLIRAMRVGEVAFVTPFRYTVMVWALVVGYFVFNEIPDTTTIIGCSLLIVAGLYSFWRERKIKRG
ncbi:DMT family transporter [Kiloniella sp. EL199]|uniref:DMT family transporter n=1 Tax=Kiloniella sp. EL199 TaxID=2107581 RepID=UPI000EA1AC1B|nr:DMT family transporter [Kiloniella sp. EL199]